MSLRAKAPAKPESHLTIREFTNLVQTNPTMTDAQMIAHLELKGSLFPGHSFVARPAADSRKYFLNDS